MPLDLTPYTDPLSRTPNILRAMIEGKPDAWLDARHADEVFSPREGVAHMLLVEAEGGWVGRIQKILDPSTVIASGAYAEMKAEELAASRSLDDLLTEFVEVRKTRIQELSALGLTAEDLSTNVVRDGFGTVTVENLLNAWVSHDLYHMGQILKSYSSQFVEKIGPYQQFLNLPQFN